MADTAIASFSTKATPVAADKLIGTDSSNGSTKNFALSSFGLITAGMLPVAASGVAGVRLQDTAATGAGYWDIAAKDFYNQGGYPVHNHTLGIQFNEDASILTHPQWGENWEPRYVAGAPPNGLLEKNWGYTSIDRSVTYRPFNFNVDLNTHSATMFWRLGMFDIDSRTGSTYVFRVNTATPQVQILSRAQVDAGPVAINTQVFAVAGNSGSATFMTISPTALTSGTQALSVVMPTIAFDIDALSIQGPNSGRTTTQLRNTGTGGANDLIWGGSSGDAWTRWLANGDWSAGVDRSDSGNFKISGSGLLGTSDRLSITSAGVVNIATASTAALQMAGTKVLGLQGAAVADATDAASVITQLNALLARLRASTGHGLIA